MKLQVDVTRPYGLVLEGGGARGAYQIGVWKALKEAGIHFEAIAGTSVGALNGAMICMDDIDKAYYLWRNISHSQILDVDQERMEEIYQGKGNLPEILLEGMNLAMTGGADTAPLRELISDNVDEEAIRNCGIDFIVSTFSLTDMKELDMPVDHMEPGRLTDYLMASSLVSPVFKNEKMHGKRYLDGGYVNKVPLDSLINRGYKNIIVVRIFGFGWQKLVEIPEEVTVHTIAPRVNLGYLLDFDGEKSVRNIKIGYYDAKRWLYGLSGLIYYIDEDESQDFYLKELLDVPEDVKQELCKYFHADVELNGILRCYMEDALPGLANMLGLNRNWDYKELYLSVLEATAKQLKVPKYNIYTVRDLKVQIRERYDRCKVPEKLPIFTEIIR